jgi:hypothetical protein
MAEIRVERKPKRKIWPLILGLLVAALLVWGLLATMDNNDRNDDVDAAQVQQSSLAPLAPLTLAAPASDLASPAVGLLARAA